MGKQKLALNTFCLGLGFALRVIVAQRMTSLRASVTSPIAQLPAWERALAERYGIRKAALLAAQVQARYASIVPRPPALPQCSPAEAHRSEYFAGDCPVPGPPRSASRPGGSVNRPGQLLYSPCSHIPDGPAGQDIRLSPWGIYHTAPGKPHGAAKQFSKRGLGRSSGSRRTRGASQTTSPAAFT